MNLPLKAEEIGISIEAYKNLCSLFLKTTKNDLQALFRALEAEDREEIAAHAHHIKGAASNMEFKSLMEETEKLNNAAADAPLEELHGYAEQINKLFTEIETELGESE
ncbi:MAG: Hpt domain-containing protein [Spirochaetia bacterium]